MGALFLLFLDEYILLWECISMPEHIAVDIIRDREDEVLNCFLNRATNASAESLNSKIKHFRGSA